MSNDMAVGNFVLTNTLYTLTIWGISSAGRAIGSQSIGRRFESAILHHLFNFDKFQRPFRAA